MRYQLLLLLLLWIPYPSSIAIAASDTVYVTLDTNAIVIGQQTGLKLTYSGTKKNVAFPSLPDTFSNMEIISRGGIDTVSNEPRTFTLTQSFTVTSFDSGYHVILPFEFKISQSNQPDSGRMATKPLLIQVKSVAVDTTQAIRDIKDIEEVPFSWIDHWPWILGFLLVLLVVWFIWKKRSNNPSSTIQVQEPKIPPHEKALQALAVLEAKSVWQQGDYRQYHTELTDILRTFISERWNISAMEMTTDEILSLSFIPKTHDTDGISYVLKTADLVKFAKSIPLAEENQRCMHLSRTFIWDHKPMEQVEPVNKDGHGQ